jgi:trimeric autotransporter adhesin
MSHDFHSDQDNHGRQVSSYNDDLASLVACLASTFGDEVGLAVNEKVNSVLALEGVDIAAVQAQIATLNSLLAANTSGDAASAQSILAAITSIGSRVTALEGSTAVADLTAVVTGLQAALAAETQNRLDSESALQTNVDQLSQSLVSIQNAIDAGTSSACDCAALTTAIAAQATAITNLQASDASTATQVAALQTAIEALSTSAAGVAAAQATADAAAATAQAALASAAAATATANAAAASAAAAAAAVAELDARNEHEHGHFVTKAEVMDINCAAIGAVFRTAMRSRMGLGA